ERASLKKGPARDLEVLLGARKVAVRVSKSWNDKSSLQVHDFDRTSRLSVRKDTVDSVERRALKLFSSKPLAVYEGFCVRARMWRANFSHSDRKRGLKENKQEEKVFHRFFLRDKGGGATKTVFSLGITTLSATRVYRRGVFQGPASLAHLEAVRHSSRF